MEQVKWMIHLRSGMARSMSKTSCARSGRISKTAGKAVHIMMRWKRSSINRYRHCVNLTPKTPFWTLTTTRLMIWSMSILTGIRMQNIISVPIGRSSEHSWFAAGRWSMARSGGMWISLLANKLSSMHILSA